MSGEIAPDCETGDCSFEESSFSDLFGLCLGSQETIILIVAFASLGIFALVFVGLVLHCEFRNDPHDHSNEL